MTSEVEEDRCIFPGTLVECFRHSRKEIYVSFALQSETDCFRQYLHFDDLGVTEWPTRLVFLLLLIIVVPRGFLVSVILSRMSPIKIHNFV